MRAREWIAALVSTLALAPLAGALLPLFVANAPAGAGEIKQIATTRETNLRKTPRTDSEILTLVPKGITVAVGDCSNGWCRVSWNGQNGYIIARNLATAEALQRPGASVAVWPDYDHGPSHKISRDLAHDSPEASKRGRPGLA